ncbi:MAG TPA: phosphomannomutase/phosphoglucomutase [Vicinamibacteria bacterium]
MPGRSAASGVFKAYDIRGIVPDELDADLARRVGRAFIEYLQAKSIAIGRDMRDSSPGFARALCEGAMAGGAQVTDIGMTTTDMVYFAVPHFELDGGAMVTASHNPKEYNGFKLVREGALALSGDAGIKEIKEWIVSGREFPDRPRGSRVERDILPDYVRHVRSFIDTNVLKAFRVVMDAANGMAGAVAPAIFSDLPFQRVEMYFEPDGSFPNHEANPLVEENRRAIIERVLAEKADLGIAWDGDGDRCFFIDDRGRFVPGDFITALLGEAFLLKEPGSTILFDVRASWAVKDTVEKLGGRALMNRVGHAFIKKRMREENAVFGGEISGHFYFRQNYFADNGMIPALLILELMSKKGKTLSELLAPLRQKYFITGEINSKIEDVPAVLARLESRYSDGRISKLDGLSVDYPGWHFNVRPSNTEPLLRLNLEALEEDEMKRRREEVLRVIRENRISNQRVSG